ncbi:hypothetical protein [Actinomadura sp. 9N215]|uniref:hypothetical protein n=1 Tax=Actinomadura sp. 9N215 TaxID=3375150 RepID=UPI00379B0189
MAGDAARAGAIVVLPRRVATAGRIVRQLLVLGGLLIAGWLLGCAAQSAHADEMPATPPRVVAEASVLGHAVHAATDPRPMPSVVRAVVEQPPPEAKQEERVTRDAAPLPKVSEGMHEAGDAAGTNAVPASRPHLRTHGVEAAQTALATGDQVTQRTVRRHPVPTRAPERPNDHSVAGGLAMPGMTAGFPSVIAWAPAPSRAPLSRAFGAAPPAVRTAADEPSFAPD